MKPDASASGFTRLAQMPTFLALTVVAGVSLSIGAFQMIRRAEQVKTAALLEEQAESAQTLLAGRIREYNLAAWYLRAMSRWVGPENRKQFSGRARGLLVRFPELQAVEWSPRVRHDRRAEFEQQAWEDGYETFAITQPSPDGMVPATASSEYWPIYFVEPFEGNENALGLDLKHAVTSATVAEARDEGLMHLSAPIRLVQEKGTKAGVVLYIPYYNVDKMPSEPTTEERMKYFLGVFQLVFRGDDMFGKLLNSEIVRQAERLPRPMPTDEEGQPIPSAPGNLLFDGLDFAVVDRGNDVTDSLLFFRSAPMRKIEVRGFDATQVNSGPQTSRTVHFAGRYWELILRPCPEYIASNMTMHPYGAMISGLAFTLLFAAYVMTLQRRSREVEQTVAERTSELALANDQLSAHQRSLTKINTTLAELSGLEGGARTNPVAALDRLSERVSTRLEIDCVGVWRLEEDGETLTCTNAYELLNGSFNAGTELPTADLKEFLYAIEREPLLCSSDVKLDKRVAEFSAEHLEAQGVVSALFATIRQSGAMIGLVCWGVSETRRDWSSEDQTLAKAVADTVALIWAEDDRVQVEGRLRDSERLYHSLVEHLPQFIFRKDLEGRFTFVNQQLAEAHGRDVEACLGLTDADLTPGEMAEKFRRDDERVIQTGQSLEFVEELRLPSGKAFIHTCKAPLRDQNGQIIGVQGIAWDLSERYRMQTELQESTERFRNLVDSVDGIVWEADLDPFHITFVSRQAENILGYPTFLWLDDEEFWQRHLHEGDRGWVLDYFKNERRSISDQELEFRMLSESGEVKWLRAIVTFGGEEQGRPRQVRGLMIDISETKRIHAALWESTERMRLFIEHTPTSVAMFDCEMRYVLVSRRWYDDNGLVGQNLIGRSHYEVVPDLPERWKRIHRYCLEGNSASCEEEAFEREDGQVDHVRWEIHPWYEEKGAVGGIILFAEIINERVRARVARERSDAILLATGRVAELCLKARNWTEAALEAAGQLGRSMGVQRVTLHENITLEEGAQAARLKAEWLSDESERLNPGELPAFRWNDSRIAHWRDDLDSGRPVFCKASEFTVEERDFVRGGGIRSLLLVPLRVQGRWWGMFGFDDHSEERVWSSAELSALASAAGNLASAIERQLTEDARLGMERKLQEGQRLESLGVLAGGIAHDFNNLLTAILGNAGLARLEAKVGSELESSLDLIEKTAVRAGDLCKQMLAYAGKGKFRMERLDLNKLIQDTHELLSVSVSKKVKISIQSAAQLPPISGDLAQLQQILMNLVINASEAIGDSEGTITISSASKYLTERDLARLPDARDLKPGDFVSLKVADTGCGMDEATRKRIFEPFFTTKFTGRGLGLAAVGGIVRGHGGLFQVESWPGNGSEFELLLPAASEPSALPEPPVVAQCDLPTGKRVLLVDDEEVVRRTGVGMLQRLDMDCIVACDGREGVERFKSEEGRFDVVLMDMTMPEMSGPEAAGAMFEFRPDANILMMSGYSAEQLDEQVTGIPVAGFMSKPFAWDSFCESLGKALNGNGAAARES